MSALSPRVWAWPERKTGCTGLEGRRGLELRRGCVRPGLSVTLLKLPNVLSPGALPQERIPSRAGRVTITPAEMHRH